MKTLSKIQLRLQTEVRYALRRLGVLQLGQTAAAIRAKHKGNGYEHEFDRALRNEIHAGDVVLDVGANLGLYTERFAELVGPTGAVYAIEPVPSCFEALASRCSARANVQCFRVALGDREESAEISLASDRLGATHSFVNPRAHEGHDERVMVRVLSGDVLIEREGLRAPDVVKIDVEGFEEEVLVGIRELLSSRGCRAVFCEVHFGILADRGHRHAPSRIQAMLVRHGFAVSWTDASHLVARR